MAYYDGYTVEQLKNELERLNKDFKILSDAYEDLIFEIVICLNKKEYNILLKKLLKMEYFEKDDIIEMLIEERR